MMAGGGNREVIAKSGNHVLIQTLPDGSTVTLNKNSILSYPNKFDDGKRAVTLTGEAFFNITPDKQHPFVIASGEASVTVVGTTFNVKTTADETEVIVETGIVQVTKQANSAKVLPHQKAIVSKNNSTPKVEANSDELYNYYRTKEFVCHGTPLWKLVTVLNEAYDAHIVIENEKLNNLQLETTFRNESLDDILKVISSTFNIEVQKREAEIILK
jgi:ferric-dicitrate binding protein FerR (iron transport regulator)